MFFFKSVWANKDLSIYTLPEEYNIRKLEWTNNFYPEAKIKILHHRESIEDYIENKDYEVFKSNVLSLKKKWWKRFEIHVEKWRNIWMDYGYNFIDSPNS